MTLLGWLQRVEACLGDLENIHEVGRSGPVEVLARGHLFEVSNLL